MKPGETQRVTISADRRVIASYDVKGRGWRVESGAYQVEVAESASDPKLQATTRLSAQRLKP